MENDLERAGLRRSSTLTRAGRRCLLRGCAERRRWANQNKVQRRRHARREQNEMALILPPNWCLIFFCDPEAKFTPARQASSFKDWPDGIGERSRCSPKARRFRRCSSRSIKKAIETVIRGLVGPRQHRDADPDGGSEVKIQLSDVEEVLDEINTLIASPFSHSNRDSGAHVSELEPQFRGSGRLSGKIICSFLVENKA